MKKLKHSARILKVVFLFVGITLSGLTEGWGADWELYGTSSLNDITFYHYYDKDSVIYPSKEL